MAEHTTYDKMKSDKSVQVDWKSNMVHVPSEESDSDETERSSWDELTIFRYYRPESVRCHIPLFPLDRASRSYYMPQLSII